MTETNKLPRVVFRLTNYGYGIEPLLAVEETAKALTVRMSIPQRGAADIWSPYTRHTLKEDVFESTAAAKQELYSLVSANLERRERDAEFARSEFERVKALIVEGIHIPPIPEDVEG